LFNRLETHDETGFTFLGAWWARRRDGEESRYDLFFQLFIPSFFHIPGLAQVTAASLVERNRWLIDWLDEFAQSTIDDENDGADN